MAGDAQRRVTRSCRHCRAELGSADRFCVQCGHPVDAGGPTSSAHRRQMSVEQRCVLAIFILYVGVFAALTVGSMIGDAVYSPELGDWVFNLLMILGCVIALGLLPRGAWRASFAGKPSERWMLAGLVAGAVLVGISTVFVELVDRLMSDVPVYWNDYEYGDPLHLLVQAVLVAPLLEEWMDRGVLWTATRRVAGEWPTILVTASLFAFTHGLGSGFYLEIPHRFAMGLAFGFLRARSGSLTPGILAHFVNNALAVALG